jgi:hypothetical protein
VGVEVDNEPGGADVARLGGGESGRRGQEGTWRGGREKGGEGKGASLKEEAVKSELKSRF